METTRPINLESNQEMSNVKGDESIKEAQLVQINKSFAFLLL